MVCYIRKYVTILGGDIPVDVPRNQNIGGCVPGIPGGFDASATLQNLQELKEAHCHTAIDHATLHATSRFRSVRL